MLFLTIVWVTERCDSYLLEIGLASVLSMSLATIGIWPIGGIPLQANDATSVQIVLRDATIRPAIIQATRSQPLHLHIVNEGGKVHNFVVPAFYVFTSNLPPGTSTDVSFSPEKSGAFPFYSDAGGQPEAGLRGVLRVSPPEHSSK